MSSPIVFSRHEIKYLIPFSLVEPISRYVEMYCDLDPYSAKSPDGFYLINNLYFDTENFEFLERKNENVANRFNVRARSYGEDPVPPYFLEVKQKLGDMTRKIRAKVFDDKWPDLVINGPSAEDLAKYEPKERRNLETFIHTVQSYRAEPKVFTQYRRKAYASHLDEYARVTFDRDLRYSRMDEYNLHPPKDRMNHYDDPLVFDLDEQSKIILELKSNKEVPLWMLDIVRRFDLQCTGFSKYGGSALHFIVEDRLPHYCRIAM